MKKVRFQDFLAFKKKIENQDLEVLILSGSMEPFIGTNEKITVSKIENIKEIKPYTPIVFFQKEILICHCFLRWSDNSKTEFISKGLASRKEDPPTNINNLLGQVTYPKMNLFRRIALRILFK